MSKIQFLKQWKTTGTHDDQCKVCGDKETLIKRNRTLRHQAKVKLHKLTAHN